MLLVIGLMEQRTLFIKNIDDATAEFIAAAKGFYGLQKNVLNFKVHPQGKDFIYELDYSSGFSLEKVREILSKLGFKFRTIDPQNRKIFIVDEGQKYYENFLKAERFKAQQSAARGGTAQWLGNPNWQSRAVARRNYREIIKGWSKSKRFTPGDIHPDLEKLLQEPFSKTEEKMGATSPETPYNALEHKGWIRDKIRSMVRLLELQANTYC